MKISILLCLLLLTSCGTFRSGYINPDFIKYYDKFYDIYGVSPTIPINYEPDESFKGLIIAKCNLSSRRITVKHKYWKNVSENERITLIFHELGHCLLDRDHTNKYMSDNCPDSIMNEFNIHPDCFSKHEYYYYRELYENW